MLYKKIHLENKTVGIWKVTETQEELLEMAASDSVFLASLDKIRSEKRKKEKLATYCLLKELDLDTFCLEYLPSGKPQLRGSRFFISISHTTDYVAVVVSDQAVGVDIQQWDRRVVDLKWRFVSADECIDSSAELVHLLLHWCAKEALFKWLGMSEIIFTEHLHVKPFTPMEKGTFEVYETKTNNDLTIKAYYEVEKDFIFVVTGN